MSLNYKNKRTGEKRACTKCCNDLSAQLDATLPDKAQIQKCIGIIEKKLQKIEEFTDKMLDLESDADVIVQEKEQEFDYETKIRLVIVRGENYLKQCVASATGNPASRFPVGEVKLPQYY